MNYKKIKLFIDCFFYFGFLPMIILFVPVGKWITNYPIFATLLISFLYALYFSIQKMSIPKKFINKKYWQIIIFFIIVLLIANYISKFPYPTDVVNNFRQDLTGRTMTRRAQTVWFMTHIVIGYGLSVSLIYELFEQYINKRELEGQKRAAELVLYRAQINPHFFFNTMNSLYGLVISKSEKTEDAFIRFSSLLKYSYSHINNDTIPIKNELEYIQNYISLQQLRLNERTKVNTDFSIDNEDTLIPPMLLISFLENAFKYGTSSKDDCQIDINITLIENTLRFECTNRKMLHSETRSEKSVGIKNTIARLDILYPKRYELDVVDNEDSYNVKLKILLA